MINFSLITKKDYTSSSFRKQNVLENELEKDVKAIRQNYFVNDTTNNEIEEKTYVGPTPNDEQNKNEVIAENTSEFVETSNLTSTNIYDPGHWKNINMNFRDLVVEKGLIRYNGLDFPKDENNRHFSTLFYTQKLSNGEEHDRRWLVYSKYLDRVYCFYCKLFNLQFSISQLVNEGSKDWKNLGRQIRSHETSHEHITNMSSWIDLEIRLQKNKTIDKYVQEQINKEKEH